VAPTAKQQAYLDFIRHYVAAHRSAPSEADMQAFFQVSPPSVHAMVLTLEKRGFIAREPGKARSIRVLDGPERVVQERARSRPRIARMRSPRGRTCPRSCVSSPFPTSTTRSERTRAAVPRAYDEAFEAIAVDPNNDLWVAEHRGAVAGVFQLTVIQYLANRGGRVAQIENVVVDPELRGRGWARR